VSVFQDFSVYFSFQFFSFWMKWIKRLLVALGVLGLLLGLAFLFRAPLLRGAAGAWIVNEPLTNADAIVVLGGGPATRPFAAAKLFHAGLAPKILLTNPQPAPATQLGLTPTDADLERDILLKEKVPADDIVIVPKYVNSTYEEALAIRDWARTNAIHRLIIPTDDFQTRRARWVFRKELRPLGVQVLLQAVPVREFTATNWWQREQGVVAFQNEVLKYAYYRVKY
jgi:uncharacterized SAM-binding protein YcdF (DUF218 family)